MKIKIGPKLKKYADDQKLSLLVRRMKVNCNCSKGKILAGNKKLQSSPQVIEGTPALEYKDDYVKQEEEGITFYLQQQVVDEYLELELELEKFLLWKKIIVKNFIKGEFE